MNNMNMSKLKIIAAGGGGPATTSRPAIEAALRLATPEKPNVLIIPTAKRTQTAFDAVVPNTEKFFRSLGLKTELLHQFDESIDPDKAQDLIADSDLIYTAGGDTLHLMDELRRHQLDNALAERALAGRVVLSGVSAGAILPTLWGHSDSMSYRPDTADNWEYIRVNGLGLAPFAITPHFGNTSERLG
ncbi:MAG: Type 1 glutamine amidotransferase-like domain-containing protein, partial [Sphaerimonospora mesophila]